MCVLVLITQGERSARKIVGANTISAFGVAPTRSSSSSTFAAHEAAKLHPSERTDLHASAHARHARHRDNPGSQCQCHDDDDCIHAAAAAAALIQPPPPSAALLPHRPTGSPSPVPQRKGIIRRASNKSQNGDAHKGRSRCFSVRPRARLRPHKCASFSSLSSLRGSATQEINLSISKFTVAEHNKCSRRSLARSTGPSFLPGF